MDRKVFTKKTGIPKILKPVILITRCMECNIIVSGRVLFSNEQFEDLACEGYTYQLFADNSIENQKGFKIGFCRCL